MSHAGRACCALALAALVLWIAGPLLAARRPPSQRLEKLRVEIEEREARARSFRQEAEGYLGELEGIDRELTELRRSLQELRRRERTAEAELGEATTGLADVERALGQLENAVERRLVALYKLGRAQGLESIYGARDFQTMVRRGELLGRIVEADVRLFSDHRLAREGWEKRRGVSLALLAEVRDTRREVAGREEQVRQRLVERRNLVDLLRSRSQREERAAGELREAAERLAQALEKLPTGAQPSPGSGLGRGLPRPVSGSVRLGFGRQVDPEFGTETLRNGIEIAAERGAQVVAVAAGRVLFSGWFRGYGQIVILDHGDDAVSVSGFLEERRVDAGDGVRRGDVIGTVGETGSLSGPGLYFEIRRDQEPEDPIPLFSEGVQ